jgi:DNA-3-methyladenine glycosylase I
MGFLTGPVRIAADDEAVHPETVNDVPDGITLEPDGIARCWWGAGDELYRPYHDREWGRPVADDRRLFEKLSLEGFMSGLSWLTILRKRENFRAAFAGFEIEAVAGFGADDVDRLLADAGIVRHRRKIEATVNNARRCLEVRDEFGSLAAYAWSYEPDPSTRPATLDRPALEERSTTPESVAMSKDLRRRGWSFVGPTTVYAFMEAMGLVNDHLTGCFARPEVEAERAAFPRPSAGTGGA